jgi:hypothetical protein
MIFYENVFDSKSFILLEFKSTIEFVYSNRKKYLGHTKSSDGGTFFSFRHIGKFSFSYQ